MIDRQAIATQIRDWAEQSTGLGFKRADQQFWEEGGLPEPLRALTARGVATRSRKKPDTKVVALSPAARSCGLILDEIRGIDDRYHRAVILYACVQPIARAAKEMRRSLVDFVRFAEGGFAIYAVYERRACRRPSHSRIL